MRHGIALRRLGFDRTDRVALIHADDIGMCQATLSAFFDLVDAEGVTSGSLMVPCPWFPEAARQCRARPSIDIGVHLTLNSEWDGYRWGPISTRDPATGLIDAEGYFYRNPSMLTNCDPEALRVEMEAQVDRARQAGLDITHLDSHMFAPINPRFVNHYVELGFEHRLPVMIVRQPQWVEILSERAIRQWEERGLLVFDHLREMYLNEVAENRLGQAKEMFNELPPGLTFFMLHPARDTPELRAMTDDWQQRVADYETFMSSELREHLRESGIQTVGWREIRDTMRAGLEVSSGLT